MQAYSDKSGFNVCGVTLSDHVARTWYNANDENDVFVADTGEVALHYLNSIEGWRQRDEEQQRKGNKS